MKLGNWLSDLFGKKAIKLPMAPQELLEEEIVPRAGPPKKKEAIDTIGNWMTGQGGSNDPMVAAGYLAAVTINEQIITNACRASWLARKIVWKKPKDMMRSGYDLIWEGSGEKKNGQKSTEADTIRYAIVQKWDADSKIIEAMAWARMFGGSIVVLDIKGHKLEDPLPIKDGKIDYSCIGKNGLQSITVWDRYRASHDNEMDKDPHSMNRGKPLFNILSSDGGLNGQKVHWTRCLRFDGDIIDWQSWRSNSCWHDSVLQVLFEPLKQYDSTTSAISSLIPKSLRDIIFAKGAAKAASTSEGEAALSRRYAATNRIASMWNVSVYDMDNEKHEQRTFNFSGLDKIWEKSMKEVGGGAGYPVSVLFDDQPSGLNSSGDSSKTNYYDDVEAERKLVMEKQHEALVECITRNELGELPAGFAIEYRPMWQTTASEQATINKINAEADHIRIDDGIITPGLAAREAKEMAVYKTMTQDDIDLAEMAAPLDDDLGEDGPTMPDLPSNLETVEEPKSKELNRVVITPSQTAA